jgi:myo-inositol-1(or 4)-monophosphatase
MDSGTPSLADMQRFIEQVADDARTMSLAHFRRPIAIDTKADDSPVTIADRNIEAMVRERIAETYPTHGIFGEEHGKERMDAEFVWVIDPIDGTRSFISGWPLWGSLYALLHHGKPVLGMIDVPAMNERWIGLSGSASLNGEPCHASPRERLSEATLYATSPDIFSASELACFEQVCEAAHTRRFGGDCYCYAMLASGHVDAVVEAGLQPYDYLASAPIIEAAGGVITDWRGRALTTNSGGRVVAAATPALHQAIIAITATLAE